VVSGEVEPSWSSFTVTPAITRSTGVGPALHWMKPETDNSVNGGSDSGGQEQWSLLMVTQRLHRWNGAQYQANLWAGVGAGLLTIVPGDGNSRDNRAAWSPRGPRQTLRPGGFTLAPRPVCSRPPILAG
jgi:hypothetical protein